MIILLNSAMMPTEGMYTMQRVNRGDFARLVADAHRHGELTSYIGYAETAQHIERVAGVPVPVSREQIQLAGPTTLLVCRLIYRLADPRSKGNLQPADDDFEYFLVDYVPSR